MISCSAIAFVKSEKRLFTNYYGNAYVIAKRSSISNCGKKLKHITIVVTL